MVAESSSRGSFQPMDPTQIQGLDPHFFCLLHWQAGSYHLCYLGSPYIYGNLHTERHTHTHCVHGVLSWLSGKESACQRNQGFDPWVGKITWRRNLLQHSCLEKPMNKEAWWAMVHRVTKSQPQLSDWAHMHPLCVSLSIYLSIYIYIYSLLILESWYLFFPLCICCLSSSSQLSTLFLKISE